MTSHLDEGVLNALLDGEIPSSEIPALQAHLASCEACQTRLEESRTLRDEAFSLIEVLDETTEAPSAPPVAPLRSREPVRRRVWPTRLAWAASIALAASAGYFVSGSRMADPAGGETFAAVPAKAEIPATLDRVAPAPSEQPVDQVALRAAENRVAANSLKAAGPPAATDRLESTTQPALADERGRRDAPVEERVASRLESADPARQSRAAERERDAAGADAEAGKRAAKSAAADSVVPQERAAPAPAAFSVTGATRVLARSATAVEAIRVLGGSLRLIEGMVPERIAIVGDTVQVVYATSFGPLLLEQWRDGELRSRLVTPAAAPADSIEAWRRRTPGSVPR